MSCWIVAYLADLHKVPSALPLQVPHALTILCAMIQIGVSHLRYTCNSARLSEDARYWRYWRHQISCQGNYRALVASSWQQSLNSWDVDLLETGATYIGDLLWKGQCVRPFNNLGIIDCITLPSGECHLLLHLLLSQMYVMYLSQ